MKKNVLRKPLINSAIILGLLTLLLYLTSSSPEATVWSSMGLIIITVLRTLQWIIAITIGLLICIVVLFAIFFGALTLFDRGLSGQMYEEFLRILSDWFLPVKKQCDKLIGSARQHRQPGCSAKADHGQNEKLNNDIEFIESQLHTTKEVLNGKIELLSSRIDDLENMAAEMADSKQLETLSDEVQGAVDSLAGIQGAVDTMRSYVEQTGEQIKGVSPDNILGDLPERLRTLEQQRKTADQTEVDITPLKKDIATMQSELALVKEKADKALRAAVDSAVESPIQERQVAAIKSQSASRPEDNKDNEEEHRIFSYFDSQSDKKKIADLVQSTLSKDMTYKQVINFMVKELGTAKGKLISSHPSLTKDYIRQCRKNS